MNFMSILRNQKFREETRLDLTVEKMCVEAKKDIIVLDIVY